MDIELARMVAMVALRTSYDISNLAPLVGKYDSDEASKEELKLAIGSAVYEVGIIAHRIFEKFPEIKSECEARLEKYGRSYF